MGLQDTYTILAGRVEKLLVTDSTVQAAMLSGTHLAGPSVIERTTLQSMDFEASTVENLTIRGSTIDGHVGAAGARFSGLRLEQVRYGALYRLLDPGAAYHKGDRFPPKGP